MGICGRLPPTTAATPSRSCTTSGFDLVVLDWMMPEMDGLEVLRRLREDAHTRDVRVILYSAADDQETADEAAKLGACDCVLKSGGFFALYDRIESTPAFQKTARPACQRKSWLGAPGARRNGFSDRTTPRTFSKCGQNCDLCALQIGRRKKRLRIGRPGGGGGGGG
jgi:DNA-binding response OmpR family regulator